MENGEPSKVLTAALFVALMATAICLGPALAHLFELPNKIGLEREQYFTVQQIYRGWNLFALVLLVQLVSIITVIVMARHSSGQRWPAIIALLGLIAAQGLFWAFTFPANVATNNWMDRPANWEALRKQWEYSHAGGAVFQLIALAALIVAALRHRRIRMRRYPTAV